MISEPNIRVRVSTDRWFYKSTARGCVFFFYKMGSRTAQAARVDSSVATQAGYKYRTSTSKN